MVTAVRTAVSDIASYWIGPEHEEFCSIADTPN